MKKSNVNLKVLTCLLLLLIAVENAQAQQLRIGSIEYFGTKDVDVDKVKRSLTVHEGDQMSLESLSSLISQVKASVRNAIGSDATDVAPVCCDIHDGWIIYIGLPGKNSQTLKYNALPLDTIDFPPEVLAL